MKKRCLVGREEEYSLLRSLANDLEIDFEIVLDMLVAVVRDYSAYIHFHEGDGNFETHIESIVDSICDDHGTLIDDYHVLYVLTERLFAMCRKYKDVGIFKDLRKDGDFLYETLHIPEQKMILLVEIT